MTYSIYDERWDEYDDIAQDYYDHERDLYCPVCYEDWELCSCDEEPTDDHAARRDAKRAKRNQMVVTGRSTKTVILPMIAKRATQSRRRRETIRARK